MYVCLFGEGMWKRNKIDVYEINGEWCKSEALYKPGDQKHLSISIHKYIRTPKWLKCTMQIQFSFVTHRRTPTYICYQIHLWAFYELNICI